MPEWSIGAVSKTVDQLAGPRVRIPVSPRKKDSLTSFFDKLVRFFSCKEENEMLIIVY